MSERPWYKRYPSDFISGTILLNLEEKGLYSILIDLMYDRGGAIPHEPRDLARICGCTTNKFNKILARLIELKKISLNDNFLTNPRVEKQIEKEKKEHEKLSENGKKRWSENINENGNGEKNDKKLQKNEQKVSKKLQKTPSKKSSDLCENNNLTEKGHTAYQKPEARSQINAVVASARESPGHVIVGEQIAKITGWDQSPNWLGNYSRIEQWLADGWDPEKDIYPTVRRLMGNRTDPPNSLKYFEQAIADAYSYRTSPTPKGSENGKRKPNQKDRIAAEAAELLEQFRSGPDG